MLNNLPKRRKPGPSITPPAADERCWGGRGLGYGRSPEKARSARARSFGRFKLYLPSALIGVWR